MASVALSPTARRAASRTRVTGFVCAVILLQTALGAATPEPDRAPVQQATHRRTPTPTPAASPIPTGS